MENRKINKNQEEAPERVNIVLSTKFFVRYI